MTWQLKRNDNNDTVELPEDMQWGDEFKWSKIAQSPMVRSITGAGFVNQGTKKSGRPITITGNWAWHPRINIETLRDWTDVPKLTMTLTHPDGRQFNVIWRLHETAIDANPVDYQAPEEPDDPYTATFKLMTV